MTRRLELRVMGPPVAGFLLVAAYVAVEALGFRGFAVPQADTISEAAALGHAARAMQLIAEGQNPNGLLHVREGIVDHAAHDLTPIESAILGRHAELVRLLQRSGAAQASPARASCFARMRLPDVLEDLGASSGGAPNGDADVETTIRTCLAEDAAL